MDELKVDEVGMNFHSIYLSYLGDGIHVYYFTKFPYINGMKFHFIKEWIVGDVFDPIGRYELHLKEWDVFNLKGKL
jgi:hypothetical protein